ncbi:FdhF/YdeP family oxidoreductase [Lewinella sp. LCG006]|uniref:FdhF/YdeP family oxidoreductase n=1 Tax=Lewinella sp. LCG006 TaxID=3231911 RepID=UPI00346012DE
MPDKKPTHETPPAHTGLKIKTPKVKAAGIPGVTKAVAQANRYMKTGQAIKVSLKLNQKGGIDCPGCAWPDSDDDRSRVGEYCENGIKAIAEEAQKTTIGRDFFAQHSVEELGDWSDFQLGKAGRIAEPMVLEAGGTHYQPISWAEANAMMAKQLKALDHPDEAVFYTSGRTSNEAAFMYQLMVRSFGTNNMPDCSNMCHESSGHGLNNTIGTGKGTVSLEDIHHSDLLIIIGQNPGTNHPRMLSALEKCKENGGQIITINPLQEAGLVNFVNPQRPGKILTGGTPLTDLYLPVAVNGDVALLKAIMLRLWHQDREQDGHILDWDFISEKTANYEAFVEDLRKQDFTDLTMASGVPRAQILKAVEMIRKAKSMVVCWAMGITQQENGVANVQEIVNLLLMKGAIGKPGSGACPVRGHSNVQGNRTVGIWESPKKEFLDQLATHFGIQPPRKHGYATVEAIQAMHAGKVKVFFALGGNFLSAAPDTAYTAAGLKNCQLTVHVSTKLNRSHLVTGQRALILPCLGRTETDVQAQGEQFVTVENSMGIVHRSKGILPPCSEHLLSEPAIIGNLAAALLGDQNPVPWQKWVADYDLVREAIEKTIPEFAGYNEKVREDFGFYLANGPREGHFPTPDGKAHFTVNKVPQNRLKEGEYQLMTIRSHDQFNTTIYGLDDRYRGIKNERRVVFINPEDMKARGWQARQVINMINEHGGTRRVAESFLLVPYDIPRNCLAAYFPEANVLVPIDSFDDRSKTPASKRIVVRLEAVSGQ